MQLRKEVERLRVTSFPVPRAAVISTFVKSCVCIMGKTAHFV